MIGARNNSHPARTLRRQLFIAPRVQGRLLLHVMLYCLLTSVATASVYHAVLVSAGCDPSLIMFGLPIVVSLLFTVPIALYDAARVSNRLIGPFVRVQGAVRRLANRDPVSPLELRANGDWNDWIEEFNTMVSRVQSSVPADDLAPSDEGAQA